MPPKTDVNLLSFKLFQSHTVIYMADQLLLGFEVKREEIPTCKMYLILALCCFRSLGVHVSKVRSLILDAWEPEQVKVGFI